MNKAVRIQSKMNGMALTQSEGEHKSRPGDLIATTYYNGLKQQWYLISSNENFVIRNALSTSVLDVENGSSSVYTGILCYKHHGDENQLWKIHKYKNYPNVYYIENLKTGYVLEIEGGINAEGMRIVQNKMYGNLNQLWMID